MKSVSRLLSKVALAVFFLCLFCRQATCQQRGYFFLGGCPSVIIGQGNYQDPSVILYSLEAGISYSIIEPLRLYGSIGGYRNVMSLYKTGRQALTSNGPMARFGADYIFRLPWEHFRPSASLSAGYRLTIPGPKEWAPAGLTDGAFIRAGFGADIIVGGITLNISLVGELTQSIHGATGLSIRFFLP